MPRGRIHMPYMDQPLGQTHKLTVDHMDAGHVKIDYFIADIPDLRFHYRSMTKIKFNAVSGA